MKVNIQMFFDKKELLSYLRDTTEEIVNEISERDITKNKKSEAVNKLVSSINTGLLKNLDVLVKKEKLTRKQVLDAMLMINYCTYIIMLESRNKVWEYEYMAFARRIGELWEPFAKLPFKLPINDIELVRPTLFRDFQENLKEEFLEKVNSIKLMDDEKGELLDLYNQVWYFVDSGAIQLKLDLHFTDGKKIYNVDYKSGFGSNEKGNTNRLLTVASILKMLNPNNEQMIFVRQKEEENNHYLKTLKNSGLFNVYCGDEAYEKISDFTGYDIKKWINENMDWSNDISEDFREFLVSKDLLKYLQW